jgi:type IV secretion system protein VirB9
MLPTPLRLMEADMRCFYLFFIMLLWSFISVDSSAVDVPVASRADSRIRTVLYKPQEVILVRVQRGVVTRIMLENDEKIRISVVGLSARCDNENDEWCINATQDANQIFVRPRDGAMRNNMELHTSKRDYSFAFEVLPSMPFSHGKSKVDASSGVPFFRVVMEYSKPVPVALTAQDRIVVVDDLLRRAQTSSITFDPQRVDPDYGITPTKQLRAQRPQIRNSSYSKQVLPNGQDAEPSIVFDDGRFTYFEFSGAREIPAIFAYGSDGQPTRVNWHMDQSFVVVQRTARKFTLRLGNAVVGIFNESFDTNGIDTPTSTVSSAVSRELKDGP